MSQINRLIIRRQLAVNHLRSITPPGPAGLPAEPLQTCTNCPMKPLEILIQKSLDTGEFPELSKDRIGR